MVRFEDAQETTSSAIAGLAADMQPKVEAWRLECGREGILVYIYEGYRTPRRQAELYAQGRTEPGRIVTRAQPWQTFHNFRRAFDWVPLVADSKVPGMMRATWNATGAYELGAKIALSFGLRPIQWESGHLEDARWPSWRELQAWWIQQGHECKA